MPSQSPFGDSLLCPVCMVIYEGRILQCPQGHAVCEKCENRLKECPTCRRIYTGTRNYVLEEIVAKLNGLNSLNDLVLDEDCLITNDQLSNEATRNEVPSDTTASENSEYVSNQNIFLNSITPPVQGSGLFACRILGCTANLPICRLLNHLRYMHKDFLEEKRKSANPDENTDYIKNWTLPCRSFRKAFHIYQFGIFFLIINVTKQSNETNIKAWVQGACSNRNARNFRFFLTILMDDAVATFTDYIVGAQSDVQYIQSNNNCLNVDTKENYQNIVVEMKISRNQGPKNMPRSQRTDFHVRTIPPNISTNNQTTNTVPVNANSTTNSIRARRRQNRSQNQR